MKWMMMAVALMIAGSAFAQISPEEAKAKLEERNAKRQAERNQKVEISAGELADLRAKVAQLEAEVKTLRAQVTPKAVKKPSETIEIGMTKEEVLAFIKSHGALQVVSLSSAAPGASLRRGGATDTTTKRERMVIARYGKVTEQTGTQRNALGGSTPIYSTSEKEEGRITVTLSDGVVTEVNAE